MNTVAKLLGFMACALVACVGDPHTLYVSTPHFLAVGSVTTVDVEVAYEILPSNDPIRLVSAACEGARCETTIAAATGSTASFALRALEPGDTALHVVVERGDQIIESTTYTSFSKADRIEVSPVRRAPIREGVAVLTGAKLRWHFDAYAPNVLDPLVVSIDDTSFEIKGSAFSRAEASSVDVAWPLDITLIAKQPGLGSLVIRAAGVGREIPLRAVGPDDVDSVDLYPIDFVQAAFATGVQLGPRPYAIDAAPIASESLVPVLRLRDGSIAIGGEQHVTFDPPELVTVQTSDGFVRLRGEAEGRGRLRFRVGQADLDVEREVKKSPYY